jgi:hypothetical protein
MMRHDAEKLLGGYAAGILTAAEKTALFSTALEHQELFEALADEEALRELLADPEARRHLLALLGDAKAAKPIRLWRRPAVLGLAASLLAMVTTSVLLWQRENPVPSAPVADESTPAPKPGPPARLAEDSLQEKVVAPGTTPASVPPSAQTQGNVRGAATAPALVAQPASRPGAEAEAFANASRELKAEAAPEHRYEAKKRAADRPQAPTVVEVVSAAASADKTRPAPRLAKDSLEQLPRQQAAAADAALPSGVALGGVQASAKASATQAKRDLHILPPPTHVLEHLEHGTVRLTVTWASGNHLYVLKRGVSGTALLAPVKSVPNKAGATQSTFEFPLGAKDHVNLYLLPQPAADPKNLPAEGEFEGHRLRVL